MPKYCIFGDSITRGGGDPEHGGWAGRFLRERESVSDDRVYVLGINGDTSSGLLARMEVEARARKPDVIMIAIGINDSRYYKTHDKPENTVEGFGENLGQILKIARTFTNNITFVGFTRVDESKTQPISWSPEKYYNNATISVYEDVLKTFCQTEQLPFVDVSDVLTTDDVPDGIHPSPDGYQKLFDQIRKFI